VNTHLTRKAIFRGRLTCF